MVYLQFRQALPRLSGCVRGRGMYFFLPVLAEPDSGSVDIFELG